MIKGREKGCEILNAVVFRRMREWVIEVSEKRLATRRFTAGQRLEDKLVLGSLYHNHGRYEKAEPILIECTEYFRRGEYQEKHGDDHFNRYVSMNYLGALHGKKNRHNKAEKMLQEALKKKQELTTKEANENRDAYYNRAHVAKGHYELGRYYEMCRNFAKAWEQYHMGIKTCDEGMQKFPDEFPGEHLMTGMNHINRMTIVDPPKSMIHRWPEVKQQMEQDFDYVRDIINRIKDDMINQGIAVPQNERKFGENHQLLVYAQTNIAKVCDLITNPVDGEPNEAAFEVCKKTYLVAIKRSKEVLGDRHPETVKLLKIMSNHFRFVEEYYKKKGNSDLEILNQQYANFYFLDYRSKI
jgi:tetratricopeptide (TPR) repeat protein